MNAKQRHEWNVRRIAASQAERALDRDIAMGAGLGEVARASVEVVTGTKVEAPKQALVPVSTFSGKASSPHVHTINVMPNCPTGYAVCECGATLRIENGWSVGDWHACALCSSETEASRKVAVPGTPGPVAPKPEPVEPNVPTRHPLVPTSILNGSGLDSIERDLRAAYEGAVTMVSLHAVTAPHGRDYNTADEYTAAYAAWARAHSDLTSFMDAFEARVDAFMGMKINVDSRESRKG